MQITINNLIADILKSLDYNKVDPIQIRILTDRMIALQDDYLALGRKHLELEQRYKILFEKNKERK